MFDGRGFPIHFEIVGSGSRVFFFNGSGASIETSRPLIEVLAREHTVLVHDQRGLGLSGVPDGPYEMSDYSADALALMSHVGWEKTAVFGISFGGMVALEFAVTHPQVVNRLYLACTSAGGAGGSSYPLHELARRTEADRRSMYPTLVDSRFDSDWLKDHPNDAALLAPRPLPTGREAMGNAWQLDARSRHDVWDRLGKIDCPTLVASGRYDGIAPMDNGEKLAHAITDAAFEVYEGGHMFLLQDRRALADVRDFLGGS